MRALLRAVVVGLLAMACSLSHAVVEVWRVPPLYDWPFGIDYFGAINDRGAIVGTGSRAETADLDVFLSRPVLIHNGNVSEILTPFRIARAHGISNAGHVTGNAHGLENGRMANFAFRKMGDRIESLGTLNGLASGGLSINDAGAMTGYVIGRGGSSTISYIHDDQGTRFLEAPGVVSSYAYGINNRGEAVGAWTWADGTTRAILHSGGMTREIDPVPGRASVAQSVNDRSEIVGRLMVAGTWSQPYFYSQSVFTEIPGTGGNFASAFDVNDHGQVVGTTGEHAFFWSAVTGTVLLDSLLPPNSNFRLYRATGINNRGDVIAVGGQGCLDPASCRGIPLLLSGVFPVPEPAPWILFLAGVHLIAWLTVARRPRACSGPEHAFAASRGA